MFNGFDIFSGGEGTICVTNTGSYNDILGNTIENEYDTAFENDGNDCYIFLVINV